MSLITFAKSGILRCSRIAGLGGERIDLTVTGPLGTPVNAHYGYLSEKNTAILEMAAAAGIILVRESEKNPLTEPLTVSVK